MEDKGSGESARNQARVFREVTGNVIAELRSQEIRDTFAAVTLSEVLEQHLETLTGGGRIPSRKARLEKIYKEFKSSIEAMQETSPNEFRIADPRRDVNTPKVPSDG